MPGTRSAKRISVDHMNFVLLVLKIIASVLLLCLFTVGVLKANPRTHNPEYHPIAEYGAGFICCGLACLALYHLWI